MQQPFVMRNTELNELHQYLQDGHKGKRQVCFIVGEAGAGKSRLVSEFLVEAEKKYEDLLFLVGICNAQTGAGDSYLPFRHIIYQLLGNNENIGGLVSNNSSKRLHDMLKTSGRALVEMAPELIGSLIPGGGILMSLGKFAAEEIGWLDSLKETAEKATHQEGQINSEQLMFQYTALIRKIASEKPLIIVLDDLQWADEPSISLLFHLIRELEDSPILFIGMYRPNDIELDRNGKRHPLKSVLNEIKRYHGDVWIDLNKTQQENGRLFVNDFLDTEPNSLDETFRQRLFKLTSGHPLFTLEIVRNMQDANDIVRNDDGYWIIADKLNWKNIPARIEAVIDERIQRLDEELQDWLTTASVEGQIFTAQVLASIHNSSLRHILKRLSRELDKKHHLVREFDEVQTSDEIIFQHIFFHSLFQQHLYSTISTAERRFLHGDVAKSLEDIYDGDISSVSTQLAYHYIQAGNTESAITYLTQSAEYALSVSDITQVRLYVTQAFEILPDLEKFDGQRGWLHYLLGRCEYYTGSPHQAKTEFTMSVKMLIKTDEQALSVYPMRYMGDLLWRLGRNTEALEYLQRAYELSVQSNNQIEMAKILYHIGIVYRRTGNYDEGMAMLEQSLEISKKTDDEKNMGDCYNSLAIIESTKGNFDLAQKYYAMTITIAEKNKVGYLYPMVLDNFAALLRWRGKYTESLKASKKALDVSYKTGINNSIAARRSTLARTYYNIRNED